MIPKKPVIDFDETSSTNELVDYFTNQVRGYYNGDRLVRNTAIIEAIKSKEITGKNT